MKKNRRNKRACFLLLCGIGLLALPVQAADQTETATREQTFTTVQEDKEAYEHYVNFEPSLQMNGKTYLLQDISYEVLEKEYLDKKEKTIDSREMEETENYTPKQTLVEDGITYTLVKTTSEERVMQSAYHQSVTSYTDYDYEVTVGTVPQTKSVTVLNENTGQNEEVICNFTGLERLGSDTVSNQITITYINYGADYYEWNGNIIPQDDYAPALTGYEAQLLTSVGAEPGSRITGISWSTGIYEDGGVLCRDALATVEQSVNRYRANYSGAIRMEEEKRVIYHSTYEGEDPQGETRYTVKATAAYRSLDEKNPVLPYVIAGVGVVVLLAGLITLLMILAKRRKEKGE